MSEQTAKHDLLKNYGRLTDI